MARRSSVVARTKRFLHLGCSHWARTAGLARTHRSDFSNYSIGSDNSFICSAVARMAPFAFGMFGSGRQRLCIKGFDDVVSCVAIRILTVKNWHLRTQKTGAVHNLESARSGARTHPFPTGNRAEVTCVAFDSGGMLVPGSGSVDGRGIVLGIRETGRGASAHCMARENVPIFRLGFTEDGRLWTNGREGVSHLWDIQQNKPTKMLCRVIFVKAEFSYIRVEPGWAAWQVGR